MDRESDAAVVLLEAGRASSWAVRDAEAARDAGLEVIPVVLGDEQPLGLPEWLGKHQRIRADRSAPERLAVQISDAVKRDDDWHL